MTPKPRPKSHRAAKTEAKRIVEVALAKHGVPKKSGDFIKVIETMEAEAHTWRMVAALAIGVYYPGGPKWPAATKAAYVEAARETCRRVYAELHPYIEEYKLGFREAVAVWYKRYGHRAGKR